MSDEHGMGFDFAPGKSTSMTIAGQRVTAPEGKGLIVEDKDWELIRSKLDESILSRGKKPDLFWGGVGLVTGLIGPVIELFNSTNRFTPWPDVLYIVLFAIGVVCMLDAATSYFRDRKTRLRERDAFDRFLERIENRNAIEPESSAPADEAGHSSR